MKNLIRSFVLILVAAICIIAVYKWGWTNAVRSARLISTNSTESSYVIGFGNGTNDDNLQYHTYSGDWNNQ